VHNSAPPNNGHSPSEFDLPVDEVSCQHFVELVTEYFEGALSARTLSRVEEHLVMCDWCVTYVEQMRATIASLRERPQVPQVRPHRPLQPVPVARTRRLGACAAGSGRVQTWHSRLPTGRPPVVARR